MSGRSCSLSFCVLENKTKQKECVLAAPTQVSNTWLSRWWRHKTIGHSEFPVFTRDLFLYTACVWLMSFHFFVVLNNWPTRFGLKSLRRWGKSIWSKLFSVKKSLLLIFWHSPLQFITFVLCSNTSSWTLSLSFIFHCCFYWIAVIFAHNQH